MCSNQIIEGELSPSTMICIDFLCQTKTSDKDFKEYFCLAAAYTWPNNGPGNMTFDTT